MTRMKTKLVVAAVVLIAAVGYLAAAGIKSGWVYYLDVDSFLAQPQYHRQQVRLAGRVSDEPPAGTSLVNTRFDLLGPQQQIAVVYRGVLPQNFEPGVDVVVEGRLDPQGVFQADVLMTKCASKYQAEEHAKRLEIEP